MANTKISALTDGVTADATDRIPIARSPFASGDNRYITPTYLETKILDGSSTLQILYNNAGGVAGMAGTSWDNTNNALTITTANSGSQSFFKLVSGVSTRFEVLASGNATLNSGNFTLLGDMWANSATSRLILGVGADVIQGRNGAGRLRHGAADAAARRPFRSGLCRGA